MANYRKILVRRNINKFPAALKDKSMNLSENNLDMDNFHQNQDTLVSANALEEWHFIGLLNRSIDAVIIPNYFTEQECITVSEKVRMSQYFNTYPDQPSVSRLGIELYECENELDLAKYQEDAPILTQEMRRLVHPYISPIDRLRIELDDVWSYGCNLARLGDRKAFAGIVREFRENNPGEPHCDVMAWGFLEHYKDKPNVINQIAANIYLKTSGAGGEIVLWDEWPTQDEYKMARNIDEPTSFGLDRKKITQPKLEIKPNQGDLILFNSMRVHAVKKVETGVRMTWGCLIGYSKSNEPLVVWS